MKILYLTNGFPYPLTSGYLRHYFFIRHLSRAHQITLFSVTGAAFDPSHAEAMAPYVARVQTFAAERRGGRRIDKLSHMVSHPRRPAEIVAMREAIRREIQEQQYDALVLSGKPTLDAIEDLAHLPPLVADMCDATSARLALQLPYTPLPRRWWLQFDRHRVRRAERAIVSRADHVIFASMRDRDAVVGASLRASVLPNGIDTAFWKRRSPQLGVNTIVFTGAMNYPPNADAALVLVRDVLPMVHKVLPATRLLIVGHSPGRDLLAAGRRDGITVTGYVDDVRPYLEQGTVFAAPLRFGAGIQNKLLEALAMALPAVVSPIVADGLRTDTGLRPPVTTALTAGDHAAAIVRQLIDRTHARIPSYEGRAYVERHFNWEASGRAFDRILESTVRAEVA